MNIVFVTTELITEDNYDGGLANYVARIAFLLQEQGHNITILLASVESGEYYYKNIPVIKIKGNNRLIMCIQNIIGERRSRFIKWMYQSFCINKYLKQLNCKEKIDLVQYSSYQATALFKPKNIIGIVRISSIQKLWDKAQGITSIPLFTRICYYLESLAIKRADKVFCPSLFLADYLGKKMNKKVEVIESPFINHQIEYNDSIYKSILLNKKYLLYFGSIGLYKGIKNIANILPTLLTKYKDLYFVFVGNNMRYNGETMMDYVWKKAENYRDRIIYLGKLKHNYLFPIIDNAFAVILPSLIDNLPNTCIEAMADGKIVIGTKGASFDQLINDGENGFLCEINNDESLLNKIERILSLDETKRKEIEKNAEKTIKRLSPNSIIQQVLRFYNSVLSNAKQ